MFLFFYSELDIFGWEICHICVFKLVLVLVQLICGLYMLNNMYGSICFPLLNAIGNEIFENKKFATKKTNDHHSILVTF